MIEMMDFCNFSFTELLKISFNFTRILTFSKLYYCSHLRISKIIVSLSNLL